MTTSENVIPDYHIGGNATTNAEKNTSPTYTHTHSLIVTLMTRINQYPNGN